ncbi:MAG: tetratricopeptide repeat protein [Bacteroidales bacterium]|nr:tetratricopeptide repeat protein [Bacteroidales bacterium]
MKHAIYILVTLLVVCGAMQAQDYRKSARKGNSLYKEKKYSEAEIAYRRSLVQDSTFYKAQYNLGNAMYRQKRYTEAKKYYAKAAESPEIDEKEKSAALHNLGNCALQEGLGKRDTAPDQAIKSYQEAVEAYKNSLRVSDKNNNTKYNLAMAQQLLKQEMQNQQNQQNQNQQNQNQQQKQQQQNQDKQNHDKQKQQQQQNKDQQKKKADAERMLEALKNKEKNTLEKQKVKIPSGGRVEKDW